MPIFLALRPQEVIDGNNQRSAFLKTGVVRGKKEGMRLEKH